MNKTRIITRYKPSKSQEKCEWEKLLYAFRPRESTAPAVKRCVYVYWRYMRRVRHFPRNFASAMQYSWIYPCIMYLFSISLGKGMKNMKEKRKSWQRGKREKGKEKNRNNTKIQKIFLRCLKHVFLFNLKHFLNIFVFLQHPLDIHIVWRGREKRWKVMDYKFHLLE